MLTIAAGLFSTLIGLGLLSLSALGLVSQAGLRGWVSNTLGFIIVAASIVVMLAQILSELSAVSRLGFLIGHLVIALFILPWRSQECLSATDSRDQN